MSNCVQAFDWYCINVCMEECLLNVGTYSVHLKKTSDIFLLQEHFSLRILRMELASLFVFSRTVNCRSDVTK